MDTAAAVAFSRFGLGRRRGEAAPADARGWLRGQLAGPDLAPQDWLVGSDAALGLVRAEQMADKAAPVGPDGKKLETEALRALKAHNKAENDAALAQMILTPDGFRERLVWFWFNHFTVADRSRPTGACVGAYVREAIRPHVTGKFRDMLLAVIRHPAMLDYLDNTHSVGPHSMVGLKNHAGLNENLARECLELHTVTPASGYSQSDVTHFALLLTGWGVEVQKPPFGFRFRPGGHEPGVLSVMGMEWPEGEGGGIDFLTWLADHPATHRHLADKLVRHFVADAPPPADVVRVERVLRDTGGDLRAASLALVDLPGAWVPGTKLRLPIEYVVAVLRAVGAHPAAEPNMAGMMAGLGERLFGAPFPIGWPDRAADWAGPEALVQRVDFAWQFAGRVRDQDPIEVADNCLGPLLGAECLAAMRSAGSRQEALALLFSTPEFMRR